MAGNHTLEKALEEILEGVKTEIFPAVQIYGLKPERLIKHALEKPGYTYRLYARVVGQDGPNILAVVEKDGEKICIDFYYEKIGLSYYLVASRDPHCRLA